MAARKTAHPIGLMHSRSMFVSGGRRTCTAPKDDLTLTVALRASLINIRQLHVLNNADAKRLKMSFSLSSSEIRISPRGVLEARCLKVNGNKRQSQIDLNGHIGNREGRFDVEGQNFYASAWNVRLEGRSTLCAELESSDRKLHRDSINLDAFIGNHDGKLVFCAGFDAGLLRPHEVVQQGKMPVPPPPPTIATQHNDSAVPESIECNLCDDWPRKRQGQGRVSRVPQITLANIKSSKRKKDCPTCILVERILKEMVPNLVLSAKVVPDSIKIGLYLNPTNFPDFKVEFATQTGQKIERNCFMHSRPGTTFVFCTFKVANTRTRRYEPF